MAQKFTEKNLNAYVEKFKKNEEFLNNSGKFLLPRVKQVSYAGSSPEYIEKLEKNLKKVKAVSGANQKLFDLQSGDMFRDVKEIRDPLFSIAQTLSIDSLLKSSIIQDPELKAFVTEQKTIGSAKAMIDLISRYMVEGFPTNEIVKMLKPYKTYSVEIPAVIPAPPAPPAPAPLALPAPPVVVPSPSPAPPAPVNIKIPPNVSSRQDYEDELGPPTFDGSIAMTIASNKSQSKDSPIMSRTNYVWGDGNIRVEALSYGYLIINNSFVQDANIDLIEMIFNKDYFSSDLKDLELYRDLVHKYKVEFSKSNQKKKTINHMLKQAGLSGLGLEIPETDINPEIHKLEVLIGEVKAGNRGYLIRTAIKNTLINLINSGEITISEGTSLMRAYT